eukprot:CAMPEP_0203906910 /NCGR_PEP_ID=MMETSP0359-20131031/48478_1 /ASSEMBLY_ACC=CAM_ASM_000338 /TAXON_ID=268821 /ORGANISM="Scrippsiella Hangoei, Strain SHTV-5" /LENGTH=63 /DNA_ID=CAMNT_0050831641 /DNA_START=80 /DNA_END=267 /DNA_ORIENTATION=-
MANASESAAMAAAEACLPVDLLVHMHAVPQKRLQEPANAGRNVPARAMRRGGTRDARAPAAGL